MKNRVNKAVRYVDEYLNGKRYNPRICLTTKQAEIVSEVLPDPFFLRKGNLISTEHSLYMWKIRQF